VRGPGKRTDQTENVKAPPGDGREALISRSGLGTSLAVVREGDTTTTERTLCITCAMEARKGRHGIVVVTAPSVMRGQAESGLAAAMQAAILGFEILGLGLYLSKLLWSGVGRVWLWMRRASRGVVV
jgi:hypothetical protein